MALLPVDEALERVLDGVAPSASERVSLLDAAQRVLASDVAARLTQPPFDASAMDGYAVRAADVSSLPVTLKLIGESAAGDAFAGTVGDGEAVRIFTGAPMPAGADAVVIQENVKAEGDSVVVQEGVPDKPHIRPRGSDFSDGDLLLRAGTTLGAGKLMLAAAAGHASLEVRRRPSVAILATGSELVPPGTTPEASQIVSSNPFGIAALVEGAGGSARVLGIARDAEDEIAAKIDMARDADVLVTIGGASVGDHDLIGPVLQKKGLELAFWRIAMRPGKPLLFGRIGGQRVLGLPGNPASCLVCARVFLVPLIRRLLGADVALEPAETAVLARALGANGPRRHYMRATLEAIPDGDAPVVHPATSQDSALLSTLAAADVLIVREAGAPAAKAGDRVQILRMDF
jgi:molybdopterin molybdotransferase